MRPIYHIQIRKTGGTTVNHCFLAALAGKPSVEVYQDLAVAEGNHLNVGGARFAAWNEQTIAAGGWDYAFSHIPIETLSLPTDTMLITCFRDPVTRLASHYRMLREMIEDRSNHPIMEEEAPWASGSFKEFVDRLPERLLLNQLYMFSTGLDLDEAEARLAHVGCRLWTEQLAEGLTKLAVATGLPLAVYVHVRASRPLVIPAGEIDYAQEALGLEYAWLRKVLQLPGSAGKSRDRRRNPRW